MKTSLILAAALILGCGGVPKRGEGLIESVTTYNDGVKWDRLANAASRVPAAEREDFIDEREELAENLNITQWDVVRVRELGKSRAEVRVKYTWYLDDQGTVHETHAAQSWQRSGKAWLLVDERRTRGEPMPGLRDSEDDEDGDKDDERDDEKDEADAPELADAVPR